MERSLHYCLLGGIENLNWQRSVCRPVKQGEAAAMLGYGLRALLLEKRALPLCSIGSVCGGF
jgi:hypothetical protein